MVSAKEELVFVPLGGLGEIGMNAALYGWGPSARRQWILVDLGMGFSGAELPGIELVLPDLSFVEKIKKDLLGILITHAHEDHIGAVADLWPRLGCKLFATRFAASLLETRRFSEPDAPRVSIDIVEPGKPFSLGPFGIEYIRMAHSIPESCGLALRTSAGLVFHTGDWKIDPTPFVGWETDEKRIRELGEEGILALISDSTNIVREGESPSETDVARTLEDLILNASGRVVVTTFASNVARLRAVAVAAVAARRSVVVAGRAMDRTIAVARECGYLDGVPEFLSVNAYGFMAPGEVVLLATGSQGESRAAIARIADGSHPEVKLGRGDTVIFSSRTIPGNEKAVGAVVNGLVRQGVEIVTDRTHMIHVSGHPRRSEVARLYEWTKPRVAVPAHGEALHLAEHAAFARARGVPDVVGAVNGDVVLLGPGQPGLIGQVPSGRLAKDGNLLVKTGDPAISDRMSLAFAGIISVGIAIDRHGELAGDPDVVFTGIPSRMRDGRATDLLIDNAIFDTLDSLPRGRRRDADTVATAVEKALRNTLNALWGKKPKVHVLVMQVEGKGK